MSSPPKSGSLVFAVLFALTLASASSTARAEQWLEYYRTGTIEDGKTLWDSFQLDADSLVRDGKLIRYKVRYKSIEGKLGTPDDMAADCKERTRGQLPDLRLRSTYEGTLGGNEVMVACGIAARKGI